MYTFTKHQMLSLSAATYSLGVVLIICTTVSGLDISRVVGGQNAEDGKYPYQVSINHQRIFFICGGSIINHYYVLTAAHCIYGKRPTDIIVLMGSNYLLTPGATYAANKLIWHEKYDAKKYHNDIGLIRVTKYIEYTTRIQPISLANFFYIRPGVNATITGWGRLHANATTLPSTLQVLNVTVIAQATCNGIYKGITTENSICTLNRENQGTCSGDSGGPLVIEGRQVGIVSFGVPCATGYPDVYTRVYPYRYWIINSVVLRNAAVQANSNIVVIFLLGISTTVSYLHQLS